MPLLTSAHSCTNKQRRHKWSASTAENHEASSRADGPLFMATPNTTSIVTSRATGQNDTVCSGSHGDLALSSAMRDAFKSADSKGNFHRQVEERAQNQEARTVVLENLPHKVRREWMYPNGQEENQEDTNGVQDRAILDEAPHCKSGHQHLCMRDDDLPHDAADGIVLPVCMQIFVPHRVRVPDGEAEFINTYEDVIRNHARQQCAALEPGPPRLQLVNGLCCIGAS
eukprot:CAMPEP_0178447434 /NCGR_PEP_ID=MMETSP0689_2-20121128/41392_1 /TAXON_ID=160604 /ORGANISM="Amphidinium massartii, Strain CS-259" /LENGTH=226 /DNA_ID=CAMNT_0020072439 /DNA_START=468 /DNA_END=1145 /DNA_ORIENTATION=+